MSEAEVTPIEGVAVEINGCEVIAEKGELLIDAAERAGTYIPRFCYHDRMKPVGMCRMCIVEVDTGRGPALQPSCMIECTPGMKVDTESPATKKAQDGVLEFLLANHPLDCPVCDKGGECPLQDQTMAYGPGESRYVEEKRHKEKPIPISDLVLLDRERCILCDRCTRFAKDVAGDPLIHFINRGNDTEVNTFPDHPFASYFSGNVVQICPVGALTSTTYRFKARPWDLETTESTCQGCSVGCRISIDSSRDTVQRFSGVDIDPVNWGWLCDKGRYSSEVVNAEGRLTEPLVREGDRLVPARWADAMGRVATALKGATPRSIGVIGGARLTNEDAYAWARLFKGVIGTDNVDAQLGDGLPAEAVLGLPAATIDEVCAPRGTVLLIAPDVKEELPVLFLRLRHAVVEDGVNVIEISPRATGMSGLARVSMQPRPGELGELVGALLAGSAPTAADVAGVDAATIAAARSVLEAAGAPVRVVLGRGSIAESADVVLDAASRVLAARPDATFLPVLRRANVRGAIELGLAPGMLPGRVTLDDGREWFSEVWPTVPTERGLDTTDMLRAAAEGRLDVLVLLGADPLADFPDSDLAERAIAGARTVIAVDTILNGSSRRADVVLAAAGFAEKAGTTTNLEGRVSVLSQRVTPPGTARPDWMLAAELGSRLGDEVAFGSVGDVLEELSAVSPAHLALDQALSDGETDGVLLPLDVVVITEQVAIDGDEVAVEIDAQVEGDDTDAVVAVETVADVVGDDEPASVPAFVSFAPIAPVPVPPIDSYGLRLVATRALYDQGTLVQSAPALSGLARGTGVWLNPYDYDRLGGASKVSVRSGRATLVLAMHADAGVPRGAAAIVINQSDGDVTRLVDINAAVTELRIETA